MSRIGVLGGTFDPVHLGHLVLAEEARDRRALDRVLLVPAARSPHKGVAPAASAEDRLRMLEAAVAGHPAFQISPIEIERGGLSYTVDTVEALRSRHPGDEIVFLLGADGLAELPRWHRAPELLRLCRLVVATRPGHPLSAFEALVPALGRETVDRLRADALEIPLLGVSATDIRARVRAGRTIRYLVPPGVEAILRAQLLYRE